MEDFSSFEGFKFHFLHIYERLAEFYYSLRILNFQGKKRKTEEMLERLMFLGDYFFTNQKGKTDSEFHFYGSAFTFNKITLIKNPFSPKN